MSVGSLKKLLTLVNLGAAGLLVWLGVSFLSHRSAMGNEFKMPVFKSNDDRDGDSGIAELTFTGIPLGRFPKPVEARPDQPVETKQEEILSKIKELGDITNAVWSLPPYKDIRPSITFKYRSGEIRTIGIGDGLESRPDPEPDRARAGFVVASRYMFVGCERDEKGNEYFLFDMRCDGTDIQKARWVLDETTGKDRLTGVDDRNIAAGFYLEGQKKAAGPAQPQAPPGPERPAPPPVVPEVQPVPTPPPPTSRREGEIGLFDSNADLLETTSEGAKYLAENYDRILEDAQISSWKDSKSGQEGLEVRRIREGSVARQFGVFEQDVLLAINGRPVKSKAQAINVIKDEINNQKKTVIEARILRNGREITKRYDTRDPATRRAASKELRGR